MFIDTDSGADKSKIKNRDPATRDRIFERCQHIAKNGFDLMNFNIDKSRSEYNGIVEGRPSFHLAVWICVINAPSTALDYLGMAGVFIRLCQFHVIQAIMCFDSDSGGRGLGFAIPKNTKFNILVLFRVLQRCRSWEDWEETKRVFHAGLTELLGDADPDSLAKEVADEQETEMGTQSKRTPVPKTKPPPKPKTKKAKAEGKTCLEVVQAYFNDNWFINPWIREWMFSISEKAFDEANQSDIYRHGNAAGPESRRHLEHKQLG